MRAADQIWNRACGDVVARELTLSGDRGLADMILLHGLAMNGGLLHAVEVSSPAELVAAISGYRLFGLDAAADVVEDIGRRWGEGESLKLEAAEKLEFEADERYGTVVPDDSTLVEAFETHFAERPDEFAPAPDAP